MRLDRLLTLISSFFGFIGTLFMAKGVFEMSPDVMAKLSSTYLGFNRFNVENLASLKADLLVGVILVSFAFGISMLPFLFPKPLSKIIGSYRRTLFFTIFILVLSVLPICWINQGLRSKYMLETQQVLNEKNIPEKR